MNSLTVDEAAVIRLVLFLSFFTFIAIVERLVPRRQWHHSQVKRWLNNIALGAFNTVCIRLIAPISGTVFAVIVQDREWAVINLAALPTVISLLLFLLIFDCAIYFQHRLFHWIKPLWLMHRVHHTDLDYDVTTGSRFHPGSIIISMFIKLGLVLFFGPLPVAILIAEIVLNITSMFNHSNIRIPERYDRILRLFVVTPDMHRVHHSTLVSEHSCNYGFNFPWWDHLFATYANAAAKTHEEMDIGIEGFGENEAIRLDALLLQPLINRESIT